ncbi:MAG: UbiD family decarboxylase domain-containing protein [Gammaproteobacteria bacterium]
MPKAKPESVDSPRVSRRGFIATTTAGLAAATAGCSVTAGTASPPKTATAATTVGPYDTLREAIDALDARGRVVRIARVDQDAYEATALMYRLTERYSAEGAPAVVFDEVKINGEWLKGPVVGNLLGHWDAEALVFGLEPDPAGGMATLRKARAHLIAMARANGGRFPEIAPVTVTREQALCKQVVLKGDEIDMTRFAFLQVNPADGGRYVNTASVFTRHPKMGVNLGTYRCQLKGPRKIAVSPGEGQTGWRMLDAARKRGEKTAKVSLVLGQEPIVYLVSGSRAAGRAGNKPVDELAVAGGLRGRALEVIQSESNDFMIPAQSEMVIEGEIPLQESEAEGPYGEGLGYQGGGEMAWYMNVTTVTHRRDPWMHNSFTGVDRGPVSAAGLASALLFAQRFSPEVTDMYYRNRVVNIMYVSIDKTKPGQGLAVGEKLGRFNPVAKVVIVVDKDVDVMDISQVIAAMSSRWQPEPAMKTFQNLPGLPLDPSQPVRSRTSKVVIDATRQWPEEGGPASYPPTNLSLLEAGAPEAFERVDAKWADIINGWESGARQG